MDPQQTAPTDQHHARLDRFLAILFALAPAIAAPFVRNPQSQSILTAEAPIAGAIAQALAGNTTKYTPAARTSGRDSSRAPLLPRFIPRPFFRPRGREHCTVRGPIGRRSLSPPRRVHFLRDFFLLRLSLTAPPKTCKRTRSLIFSFLSHTHG